MAGIAPNSTVILFKDIPFDPAYNDTMYFAGSAAQKTWFDAQDGQTARSKRRVYSSLSYQRRSDNTIRLEESFSWAYNVNYMAFQNTSFENKWFYAFVENVEYINDVTIEITFRLDVIQSWLFGNTTTNLSDFMSQCTIERCHTRTDTPGEYVLPENLPVGEYVESTSHTLHGNHDSYTSLPVIVVASSIDWTDPAEFSPGVVVKGRLSSGDADYYSGLHLLEKSFSDVADLNTWLEAITEDGQVNSIVSISIGDSYFISHSGNPISPKDLYIAKPSTLGTYTPRNKKLLTYPYTFAAVDDRMGHENQYPFELFADRSGDYAGKVVFNLWGNNNCNATLLIWPTYYKGKIANESEGMESAQFPQCAWNNDTFKAMLAQFWSNALAQVVSAGASGAIAGGMAGGLPGAVASGVGGMAGAAVNQIGGLLSTVMNPANHVPSVHGVSNATAGYQCCGMGFDINQKFIREEYASMIDKYFDRYGYRVEQTGIPDINARPCWSYVKTRGASVHGFIPAAEAREIEQIFDNGIRFWTTSAVFGSYDRTQNNNDPASQNSGTGSGGSSSDPTPVTPTPTPTTPTENEGE